MQSKGKGNLSLDEVFLTASVKTITNYDFLPVSQASRNFDTHTPFQTVILIDLNTLLPVLTESI